MKKTAQSIHILFFKACKNIQVACFFVNRIVIPMSMNTKFWFATDIKTILFFVHHKNYGRIEIVGILLARLKYMSGSENVYMKIIGLLQKNYILKIIICVKLFRSP